VSTIPYPGVVQLDLRTRLEIEAAAVAKIGGTG
jgi:hypothetical protein